MNQQTRIIKSLTQEEQELLCFFRPVGYHTRLQQYLAYSRGFAARTTRPKSNISLSTTKAFRHYLRRFIRNFQPEPLLPGHTLWLHLEKSGRFSLRLGKNGKKSPIFGKRTFISFSIYVFCTHINFGSVCENIAAFQPPHCRFWCKIFPLAWMRPKIMKPCSGGLSP